MFSTFLLRRKTPHAKQPQPLRSGAPTPSFSLTRVEFIFPTKSIVPIVFSASRENLDLLPTAPQPHADVHRDNPKSQIDHHQNPNRNLHVSLLKTQTQISHAPPQIKTQTHRLASPTINQRCWRWVWLRRHEGDFCLGGSGTCTNKIGHVW